MQRIAIALLALIILGACASLNTMQTGEVTPKGDFQLGGDVGLAAPVATIGDVMEFSQKANPTTEDYMDLARGAVAVLLYPPITSGLTFRYGIARRWDLGLRFSPSAMRLDGRYQIVDGRTMDLAVGLGLGFFHSAPKLGEAVSIGNYKRGDLDVSLIMSFNLGKIFIPYFGVKWLGTTYDIDLSVDTGKVDGDADLVGANGKGNTSLAGGMIGFYLGYKWFYFVLEVNFMYASIGFEGSGTVGAHFTHTGSSETVDLVDDSFDGLIISPALGLLFIF